MGVYKHWSVSTHQNIQGCQQWKCKSLCMTVKTCKQRINYLGSALARLFANIWCVWCNINQNIVIWCFWLQLVATELHIWQDFQVSDKKQYNISEFNNRVKYNNINKLNNEINLSTSNARYVVIVCYLTGIVPTWNWTQHTVNIT